LSMNKQGQVFLVYTWNRKRIKSISWEPNNLMAYLRQVQHEMAATSNTPIDLKESQ